jgi:hypothetical protein
VGVGGLAICKTCGGEFDLLGRPHACPGLTPDQPILPSAGVIARCLGAIRMQVPQPRVPETFTKTEVEIGLRFALLSQPSEDEVGKCPSCGGKTFCAGSACSVQCWTALREQSYSSLEDGDRG